MSSWGNYDNSANAPYWAVSSAIMNVSQTELNASAPTAANVALLYGNTTPDVYTTGQTIGLFGVDNQEADVNSRGAHTGWVMRTTGSGGRAGRVQQEVLVALANMRGPDGDGQQYPNVEIVLTVTPSRTVISSPSYANTVVYTVTPTLAGNTAATLTYQWQFNDNVGGSWTNVSNGSPANTNYSGGTTDTLSVSPAYSDATGYVFRAIVTAADQGVSATSANATITITNP